MVAAQVPVPESAPLKGKKVSEAMGKPLVLPVSGSSKLVVDVIPTEAMSAEDQQIFTSSEPEIRRRAASELMLLDQPGWSIEQLACPAFPHWLLLRYTQGSTPATRSLFSVAVSRLQRQVRLIPVARKGYSAFGSSNGNPMIIGALNDMLKREDPKPPLSQIALCYAALTGAAAHIGDAGKHFISPAEAPTARVDQWGEESVSIQAQETPAPTLSLDFDHNGKLVRVSRVTSAVLLPKPVNTSLETQKVKPVPPAKQK